VRLALVEILDRDGHVRQAVSVEQWPVTIGRAIDCDVVLDDPHVAATHATVTDEGGALSLHLGDSVNGARLLNRPVGAGTNTVLPSGEVFQLGATRMRVRRASDPLAPERALAPVGGRLSLLVLAVALLARTVAEHWLDTDPGSRLIEYVPWLVGAAALLALWCGIWAAGSKLFHHRFEFSAHARIAMSYLLALGVTGLLLPLAGYALSWSFLSRISGLVGGALLCAMVWQHLTLILPARRRALALIMGTLFVAGSAVILSHNYQANDRYFTELYAPTLAPPALRLAPAVTTERFIDESRRLKAVLDAHAGDDNGADGWGIE
jgi:pSer/pThr/pTyr-binding forkhead associated (FHA) protein